MHAAHSNIWTHWRWPGSVAVTWVHIICPHDLKSSFLDRSCRDLKNLLFVFIFSFFFTEKIGLKNYLNLIFLVYIQLKIYNFTSVQYNGRVGCSQASDAQGRGFEPCRQQWKILKKVFYFFILGKNMQKFLEIGG